MSTESITFPGVEGAQLAARIDRPAHGPVRGWALFAHCFTCSKNLKPVVHISRALNARGIGVLRFDFTGLGESEGDFADTNFSSNIQDLVAAGRFMEGSGRAPELLIGHSLGGAAAIHAAHELDSVQAVATIGAPADPAHVLQHIEESLEEVRERGKATVDIGGRPFEIRRQFLEDLDENKTSEAVRTLGRALLVLHSPVDATVGIDNAARIFKEAKHPRSFVSLDDADHLLLDERDSFYVGEVIASWAARYLKLEPESDPAEEDEHARVMAATPAEGYRTELRVGRHRMLADEPASVGGSGEGPSPHDLVAAGLAACSTMTVQMYARRKGWQVEEARVVIDQETRKATADEGPPPRRHIFRMELELEGELDTEQRERLLEISGRCPVHRTLDGGAIVESELKG